MGMFFCFRTKENKQEDFKSDWMPVEASDHIDILRKIIKYMSEE